MTIKNKDKAEIISQALPYIQKYSNKIVVIKYGGSAMTDDALKDSVMSDIALLRTIGVKVVLVHGGGPSINSTLDKMNIESEFVDGLRVTNKEVSEVVQMVLAGKVNKDLTRKLCNSGINAVGLCGFDGGMLRCAPLDKKHGYVGKITKTNVDLVEKVIEDDYIPVISSVGYDTKDNTYNINADTAAAYIAAGLGANALIYMTDVEGLLEKVDGKEKLVSKTTISGINKYIKNGTISGGMLPKANSIVHALKNGVNKVFMIDGRVPHALLIEMLTNQGLGTMFRSK